MSTVILAKSPAARPANGACTGGSEAVAAVYNQAGDDYVAYADGDPTDLFSFAGMHAYADRRLWAILDTKLADLRASGATAVRILDAGCGPGTWLRRLVTRAHALGFARITARGFDIAQAQVLRARLLARKLTGLPGVTLTFDVADLTAPLPESDGAVDLSLCLYSVLSHVPVASLSDVASEIARVTAGHFVATVRSIGSPPTAFVDSLEKARALKLDHLRDRCEIELSDGRRRAFAFHLFTAPELRERFAGHFHVEEVRGLDLFHARFVPDPRWNPLSLESDHRFSDELARLEEEYAANPQFIDHACHLLLVARSRNAASSGLDRPCRR
jgi:SAM-dependent methyltransferase